MQYRDYGTYCCVPSIVVVKFFFPYEERIRITQNNPHLIGNATHARMFFPPRQCASNSAELEQIEEKYSRRTDISLRTFFPQCLQKVSKKGSFAIYNEMEFSRHRLTFRSPKNLEINDTSVFLWVFKSSSILVFSFLNFPPIMCGISVVHPGDSYFFTHRKACLHFLLDKCI